MRPRMARCSPRVSRECSHDFYLYKQCTSPLTDEDPKSLARHARLRILTVSKRTILRRGTPVETRRIESKKPSSQSVRRGVPRTKPCG
jgi:hypothetical protein